MADGEYLKGRIAIITGASRGIGAAIAERIATAGAEVICAARTVDGDPAQGTANATVERIRARGGKAHAMKVDMTDAASREALVRDVIARFGRIDILVNNAGTAVYKSTEEMPLADVEAQTQLYFVGPWHLCHLVLPQMRKQGEGRILQIGSCVIFPPTEPFDTYMAGRGNEMLYGGLKAGIHRFALGLAAELHADNIAVNVLGPVGAVLTPGLIGLDLGLTPDMEICEPVEDMAEAALDMLDKPTSYTSQFELSYNYLDRIGRSSMTLDGKDVVRAREPAHV
jgi:NAD(P)-dependent dehydrogenase (short-subunit alcohol dehydrogenase family)